MSTERKMNIDADQIARLFDLALKLIDCLRRMSPQSRLAVYRLFKIDDQSQADLESFLSDE